MPTVLLVHTSPQDVTQQFAAWYVENEIDSSYMTHAKTNGLNVNERENEEILNKRREILNFIN